LIGVYAILYDKDNRVITVTHGLSDVLNLKPGEDSAFKISLPSLAPETVDHYTLIPGGSL
jgi:hypothetical protein